MILHNNFLNFDLKHKMCYKMLLPWKKTTCDAATVELFPKEIPFPKTAIEDYLLQSASDIMAILQSPPKSLPYLQYGDSTKMLLYNCPS